MQFLFHRRVFGSVMGEGEDDSGSLDSDSDLILDGENAADVGAGKFKCMLSFIR